jgi:hypothetical protein
MLELTEHELGNEERAFHETGLHNVRDATIDNHAGVENLGVVSSRGGLRGAFPSGKMDFLSLFEAESKADVATHSVEPSNHGKCDVVMVQVCGKEDSGDEFGEEDAEK